MFKLKLDEDSRDEEDCRGPPGVVALHHDVGVVGRGQEDEEADEALLQAAEVARVDLAEEVEAEDGVDQHHEHHETQHVQDRRQALQNLSYESGREESPRVFIHGWSSVRSIVA